MNSSCKSHGSNEITTCVVLHDHKVVFGLGS